MWRGPGWTHGKGSLRLSLSGQGLRLVAHWVHSSPLSWECAFSSGLSMPCPLPFSLPSHAPSLSLLLSQVTFLTCPSLAISGRLRHFLWALGGSHRNPASPLGMDRTGRAPVRGTAPRPAEGKAQHGLCPHVWPCLAKEAGKDPLPSPSSASTLDKTDLRQWAWGEWLIYILFESHLHVPVPTYPTHPVSPIAGSLQLNQSLGGLGAERGWGSHTGACQSSLPHLLPAQATFLPSQWAVPLLL